MQLLRVADALSVVPSGSKLPKGREKASLFLKRQEPELSGDPLEEFNEKALVIQTKIDSLELQCKKSQLQDKETLISLERQLRLVSGQVVANLALQSSAKASAGQDSAQTAKLNRQLVSMTSLCKTQKSQLDASLEMLIADQSKAHELRKLSSKCSNAALTLPAIRASVNSTQPLALLLQHCSDEEAAPVLAAGAALQHEARKLLSAFAKGAFDEAVQRSFADVVPPSVLLAEKGKDWPSKSETPSAAKEKAANSCNVEQGSVNCGKLEGELTTIAQRLEEQRDAAVNNLRRQVEECEAEQQSMRDRITSSDSQRSRSNTELVRLTGIQASLSASRASIVGRLDRQKQDSSKLVATCRASQTDYEAGLAEVIRKRQNAATDIFGEIVAVQDCKVTEWSFSRCSKPCKKDPDEATGYMHATRRISQIAGGEPKGASCPPLSAQIACNDRPCPTDCVVGEWEKWSSCSKACGGGTAKRTRAVTVQAADGGKSCPVTEERKTCNVGSCSDECKLKEWTSWSACSRRCRFSTASASGRQVRTRAIRGHPVAEGGSDPCPPADDELRLQTRSCNQDICPKNITCDASQDILFLLDGSGAAGDDFQNQIKLVSAVVEASSNKVRFGVLSFGKQAQILSRMTSNHKDVTDALVYNPPTGGSRDCGTGMVVGQTLFSDPGGQESTRTAVIILGGSPATWQDTKKAADEMKASGIRLVIGLVDEGEEFTRDQVCALASEPCSANVEAVKSWDQMANEPGRFLAAVCRNLVYPEEEAGFGSGFMASMFGGKSSGNSILG
jgi:hypothetical protein